MYVNIGSTKHISVLTSNIYDHILYKMTSFLSPEEFHIYDSIFQQYQKIMHMTSVLQRQNQLKLCRNSRHLTKNNRFSNILYVFVCLNH